MAVYRTCNLSLLSFLSSFCLLPRPGVLGSDYMLLLNFLGVFIIYFPSFLSTRSSPFLLVCACALVHVRGVYYTNPKQINKMHSYTYLAFERRAILAINA